MLPRLTTSRRVLAAGAAALLAGGLAACSSSGSSGGGSASSSGSGKTLVMESSPETTVSDNFNPFLNQQAVYNMGPTGLVYEPLIQFNLANPSQQYPWLATKYAWGPDGKSITFTIRQGVKWNDGQAMTADDVAFTYQEVAKYPDINLDGLTISSVSTSGDTVTVNFPTPQYMNLEYIAGEAILPKHIWSSVGDPGKFTDPTPVGTGPYKLGSFSSQGITMTANPSYWQSVPVKKVFFPVYSSNTTATAALFSGQVDWTGNYISGLKEKFLDTDPAHHIAYEAAGSSNALIPNLTKWPTNQLPVRQAISAAIDRNQIGSEGEAGLETGLANATGITLPTYQDWAGPVSSMTQTTSADSAKAKQILQSAGYTLKSGFFYDKTGKELSLTIEDPADYTDYAADDALIAQQLQAAGINAKFNGTTDDAWNSDVGSGNFQLTMHWSNGGINPYPLYDNWLDDTLLTGASGHTGDYEMLKDSTIQSELAKLKGDQTTAQQAADLAPIEKYVAANLPIIPTTTAAEWSEINSTNYSGWPSQSNPYDSGQPSGTNNGPGTGTNEVVLLHLKPAS
jgi:peptide/nickel transport system substrate-binding protein